MKATTSRARHATTRDRVLTLVLALFLPFLLPAQPVGNGPLSAERWKEFESQKVAFFTREMSLTPAEAARFWPLYNEMQECLRDASIPAWKSRGKSGQLTEEQARERVASLLAAEKAVLEIRAEYYRRIASVLSSSKLCLMLDAEHGFRRQLVKRLSPPPPAP